MEWFATDGFADIGGGNFIGPGDGDDDTSGANPYIMRNEFVWEKLFETNSRINTDGNVSYELRHVCAGNKEVFYLCSCIAGGYKVIDENKLQLL